MPSHLEEEFLAQAPDGRRFRLQVFIEMIDASSMSNPGAQIEGQRFVRTSDGREVNRVSATEFHIVGLDLRVTRV